MIINHLYKNEKYTLLQNVQFPLPKKRLIMLEKWQIIR